MKCLDVTTGTAPALIRLWHWDDWRRRILTVIEKLVDRNFECPSEFFECFDCGNRVAVFYSGDVDSQKSGALLNVPLGHISVFPQSLQALANDHRCSPRESYAACARPTSF